MKKRKVKNKTSKNETDACYKSAYTKKDHETVELVKVTEETNKESVDKKTKLHYRENCVLMKKNNKCNDSGANNTNIEVKAAIATTYVDVIIVLLQLIHLSTEIVLDLLHCLLHLSGTLLLSTFSRNI